MQRAEIPIAALSNCIDNICIQKFLGGLCATRFAITFKFELGTRKMESCLTYRASQRMDNAIADAYFLNRITAVADQKLRCLVRVITRDVRACYIFLCQLQTMN